MVYLCQTVKLCLDQYGKLKYSELLPRSLRNKIKDDGIGLLENFVGNWCFPEKRLLIKFIVLLRSGVAQKMESGIIIMPQKEI